jgi:predicted TIM-barrel fold metal-dependent hydrolase
MAETEAAMLALFDADNHYWETSDAFTRHRDPKFADRGVQIKEVDGVLRYLVDGLQTEWLPGPADVHPRPLPGAFLDYFNGGTSRDAFLSAFTEKAEDHPDWYERDARLAVMDSQGVEATWLFPSQGVVIEPLLHTDTEAAIECYRAFNRWLEEQWGFAYQDRIFSAPYITMCDPDAAVHQLRWCLDRGARVVNIRHGAAVTRDGYRSPADPIFDGFWGLAAEAGIVVATHDGSDETYKPVHDAMSGAWGDGHIQRAPGEGEREYLGQASNFSGLMKSRTVHDFAYVLVAHRLFERFPSLKVAYIENGGAWVPSLLLALDHLGHGHAFGKSPRDQFIESCWVAPFVEEDVSELARHLPVERILFGSDWPHGEGYAAPSDFLTNVADFTAAERRRILHDNAWELTFAR